MLQATQYIGPDFLSIYLWLTIVPASLFALLCDFSVNICLYDYYDIFTECGSVIARYTLVSAILFLGVSVIAAIAVLIGISKDDPLLGMYLAHKFMLGIVHLRIFMFP